MCINTPLKCLDWALNNWLDAFPFGVLSEISLSQMTCHTHNIFCLFSCFFSQHLPWTSSSHIHGLWSFWRNTMVCFWHVHFFYYSLLYSVNFQLCAQILKTQSENNANWCRFQLHYNLDILSYALVVGSTYRYF